jgi:hypothetical protein
MRSEEEFQWAAHAKLLSSSVGQNIAFSSGPSSSITGRLLLDLKQHQNKMSLWGIRDSRNRVVQVQHDSQDGKWINFICFKQTGSAENLNKKIQDRLAQPKRIYAARSEMEDCVFSSRCRTQINYSPDSNSEESEKHLYLDLTKHDTQFLRNQASTFHTASTYAEQDAVWT